MGTLLVVVTESQPFLPDEAALDFKFVVSHLIPAQFQRFFSEEPLYLDLRWARKEEQLILENGKFQDQITTISSALRHESKDSLTGEDVRLHR